MMEKIVCIGAAKPSWSATPYRVYCKIKVEDRPKGRCLSITGVEGPLHNGNAVGGCGQIIMDEWGIVEYAHGWSRGLEEKFRATWKRWHLNDMTSGSPAQEAWLRENPITAVYPECHYTKACEALAGAGLNPDSNYLHNGKLYKYGNAWLFEELPKEVIDFLNALPISEHTPAWV